MTTDFKRRNKKILITYLTIAVFGLILLLTGYSFTWDRLDYVTIAIVVVYPVIKFFQALKSKWLKITIGVLGLTGLCFAGYYVLLVVAFATAGNKEEIQRWTLHNYKIILSHRLDWAGPAYYRYDLDRTIILGVFEKSLAQSYPGVILPDTCIVDFNTFYPSGALVYKFDRCHETIEKVH